MEDEVSGNNLENSEIKNNAVLNNPYASSPPNNFSKKWIFVLVGVVLVLVVLAMIFLFFGGDGVIKDDLKVINCGSTPPGLSPSKMPDSQTKSILACGTESLIECSPSITEYKSDRSNNTYLRVVGKEKDDCVVQYEWGEQGIECRYNRELIGEAYEEAKEEGEEWSLSYVVSFMMGMDLQKYSEGKSLNQKVGSGSAPCDFYRVQEREERSEEKKGEDEEEDTKEIIENESKNNDYIEEGTTSISEEIQGVCGDEVCDLKTEDAISCWLDCKPKFNSNDFEISFNSPYKCNSSDIKPNCCSWESEYLQYNLYYTYDYLISKGYKTDEEFSLCREKCKEKEFENPMVLTYAKDIETGEVVSKRTFFQCSCWQCKTFQNWERFKFVKVECRSFFGKNGISVEVKNTGSSNIKREDWVVHKIDGKKADIFWVNEVEPGKIGYVFEIVSTKDNNYLPGEHFIEIGLLETDVKKARVNCP